MSAVVPIRVVAGLLVKAGKVLACQRRKDALFPLKWEFPGGKVEHGEDDLAALRRELGEELAIGVQSAQEILRYRYRYAGWNEVDLRFYRVQAYLGEIENRAFQSMIWLSPEELEGLDFLEGDRLIVEKLKQKEIALDV
jgi:mutator protein MutT